MSSATKKQYDALRGAVAERRLPFIPAAIWKSLTFEEAERMLAVAGTVPAAPVVADDAPATPFQRRKIRLAVEAGFCEKMDYDSWRALTKKTASMLIADLNRRMRKPPTAVQAERLAELQETGFLEKQDAAPFSSAEAHDAIAFAAWRKKNSGLSASSRTVNPDHAASGLMSEKQAAALQGLADAGWINRVVPSKWRVMTSDEARRLIFIGQQRQKSGEKAPERPRK